LRLIVWVRSRSAARIPDGVFVVNGEGRFTLANWSGSVTHALRPEDVLGHLIVEFPDTLRLRHFDGQPLRYEEHPLVRALVGEVVRNVEKIVFNRRSNCGEPPDSALAEIDICTPRMDGPAFVRELSSCQ
jgi:PAS domain-containing protein